MKNKICILLGVLLFACLQSNIFAQAQLHTTITSLSSATPVFGTQLSVNIQLQNVSPTDTFKGIINFDLANKDSVIENLNIVGKPNYNGTFITLAPSETKAGLFTVQIMSPNFVAGPDIIIVWPIAGAIILDSARAPINIQQPLGIQHNENNKLLLWENNNELFIQMEEPETWLQDVRIFDLNGRLVMHRQLQPHHNKISVANLPAGIYMAEVTMRNGKMSMLKWVK